MTKTRLNDLTREELRQASARLNSPSETPCEHCGVLTLKRAGQKYCSPRCRKLAFDERMAANAEVFQRAKAEWQAEREQLLARIAELENRNART